MTKCVFCQIVAGEIPSTKEYEDDDFVVIKDINPAAPVHVLVLPKEHFSHVGETEDPKVLGKMLKLIDQLAEKLEITESYRAVINKGKWVQDVSHLHLHLLGGWCDPKEVPGFH